ncbi:MAG: GNAT family N-acetyltransferase [Gammaproteobacteria bacterium]
MTRIETSRLTLREAHVSDAAFVLELLNDPGWLAHIGDPGVRDLAGARDYIAERLSGSYRAHGFGLYIVELKVAGLPVGLCGLVRRHGLDDPDIGFALLERHCGRGYGLEAARATMDHARNVLGIRRVLAITSRGNRASQKLLESLGLKFERMARLPGQPDEVMLYVPGPSGGVAPDGP